MKAVCLLLLRLSLCYLLIIWGIERVIDPAHGAGVAKKFYGGALSAETGQIAIGVVQILFAGITACGLFKRWTYAVLAIWLGFGALVVWPGIIDPWGLFTAMSEFQILFYPSLVVFFAALTLYVFRDQDTLVLGAGR